MLFSFNFVPINIVAIILRFKNILTDRTVRKEIRNANDTDNKVSTSSTNMYINT